MSNTSLATQNTGVGMVDARSYELSKRIAVDLAASTLIPKQFQRNPPNCMIALNMACRMKADPLMVMQNLYIVHGNPGWSSQFLIATFNSNPKFSALRYEFKGKEGTNDWSCRAYAIEKETEETLQGSWISVGMAHSEGWATKNGSKWKTMPQQMLMYRAAAFFIRTYAPEIAMGLQTAEEVQETIDVTPVPHEPHGAPENENKTLDDKIMDGEIVEDSKPEPEAKPDLEEQVDQETGEVQENQQAEPEAAPEDQDEKPADKESPLIDALGEHANTYHHGNAAARKQLLSKLLAESGVQPADMERLVGKGYGQWGKKERIALLEACAKLANGESPADVFPTN